MQRSNRIEIDGNSICWFEYMLTAFHNPTYVFPMLKFATESEGNDVKTGKMKLINNHTPHLVMLLAGSKNTDQQWASRSPRELNEQPDLEAHKELSPADGEPPSSEEPGHQDLRRRTGFS